MVAIYFNCRCCGTPILQRAGRQRFECSDCTEPGRKAA